MLLRQGSRPATCSAVLLLVLAAVAAADSAACTGDLDCQLNGQCVGGTCSCFPEWTGANCSKLNLLPATKGHGLYGLESNWSSWGNAVRRDPKSGKWYMAADEMANNCGLGTWGSNSRCIMAESDNVTGPYHRVAVVIDPWCHGTSLERDPISSRWIFGHMGSGAGKKSPCRVCNGSAGITPKSSTTAACPRVSAVSSSEVGGALIADSPLGPWKAAKNLINSANCVPHFTTNGTLFYACPWMGHVDDAHCNNHNAGMTLSRAESLQHALAGNYTYRFRKPTYLLGGTNSSSPCANWEGNIVWVDKLGRFHSLAHAFRGQPCDYPLPGCVSRKGVDQTCTANGGHSYSLDGSTWYISPVAPFTATINYTDGTSYTFRARERSHLVMDEKNQLLFLGNGLGNPGHGANVGVPGADHTFVQLTPFAKQ